VAKSFNVNKPKPLTFITHVLSLVRDMRVTLLKRETFLAPVITHIG
jgi:hypothetical protein